MHCLQEQARNRRMVKIDGRTRRDTANLFQTTETDPL